VKTEKEDRKNIYGEIKDTLGSIYKYVASKHPDEVWSYLPGLNFWEKRVRAEETGEKIIWHNFTTIPEPFYAFDLLPINCDPMTAYMARFPNISIAKWVDISQQYLPDHICAFDKNLLGLALSKDVPVPAAMVGTAGEPCDSALTVFPAISRYLRVPHYMIDVPYWKDERTIKYVADEMKGLFSFLEELTGRRLDLDKLREVMEYSNRAYELLHEVHLQRMHIPCPLPSRYLMFDAGIMVSQIGTPEIISYLEKELEIGQKNLQKGSGAIPEEKKRIAWAHLPIMFDTKIWDFVEEKFGTIVVLDILTNFEHIIVDTSDIDTICRGLALRTLNTTMGMEVRGPAEYFFDRIIQMARDFKVDAVVFGGHTACEQSWAIAQLMKDVVYDELGIRTLIFDCDGLDPRVLSSEQMKPKFISFLETL
jgi:benzoyl-CoA reductase/2-hydroxyglutaryl-CoA dehydratase subunit BcrC/BadD/HgdB